MDFPIIYEQKYLQHHTHTAWNLPLYGLFKGRSRDSLNFASGLSVLFSNYEKQMNRPVSHCVYILEEGEGNPYLGSLKCPYI